MNQTGTPIPQKSPAGRETHTHQPTKQHLSIKATIKKNDYHLDINLESLVDSGASETFIDIDFVKRKHINIIKLEQTQK